MLPESSGEEQAELSLSIYVPIFIVHSFYIGGALYRKFVFKYLAYCL